MTAKKENKVSDKMIKNEIGKLFLYVKKQLMDDPEISAAYEYPDPEYELIASLIRLRRKRGISQRELAKAIGTKQPAIARIESGRHHGMSVGTLVKLAEALKGRLVIRFEEEKNVE